MPKPDYNNPAEKYDYISGQHGGYYRHDFIDHAYLYNLYFPPEEVFTCFKNKIHELVLNYPVAQDVLANLVGTLIDQPPERIVVGNGAAELIKIVSGQMSNRLIVPVPSFNEYVNAAPQGSAIEFPLEWPSFQLDVDKFAAHTIKAKADVAVVVTPNNPTSIAVPKQDLMRLAEKLSDHDCQLIIDESFIDFTKDPDQFSMEDEIEQYPNIAIFKSMSKAYGICGIRIGYLVTTNQKFANAVRQGVHIWNINGFAEEFLRILPDFHADFIKSCNQVKKDRDKLYENLNAFSQLSVCQPDANFIFCRLPDDGLNALQLTEKLFIDHNMYIKHCQGKTMPHGDRFIRIASRTEEENTNLVDAMASILGYHNKKRELVMNKPLYQSSHQTGMLWFAKDLPNICSLAGLLCALLGIYFAILQHFPIAVIAMIWAVLFDWGDGIIARNMKDRTKKQGEFGGQLDSLIDMVSFGICPAVFLLSYGQFSAWYLPGAFVIVATSAIRLSYFNVFGLVDSSTYKGLALDNNVIFFAFIFLFEQFFSQGIFSIILYAMFMIMAGFNLSSLRTPKFSGAWFYVLMGYTVILTIVYSCILWNYTR